MAHQLENRPALEIKRGCLFHWLFLFRVGHRRVMARRGHAAGQLAPALLAHVEAARNRADPAAVARGARWPLPMLPVVAGGKASPGAPAPDSRVITHRSPSCC